MSLTFTKYQEFCRTTALYPEAGTGGQLALAYCGLGLGESGEIQGKLKKILRDDQGVVTEEKKKLLLDEMGDLVYYVSALATELSIPLERVFERNVQKLSDRKARGVIQGSGDNR